MRSARSRRTTSIDGPSARAGAVARALAAAGDLVDLVDEDDAGLLDALHCGAADRLHVEQLGLLFSGELFERLGHLQSARLRASAEEIAHHVLQVDADLFHRRSGDDFE